MCSDAIGRTRFRDVIAADSHDPGELNLFRDRVTKLLSWSMPPDTDRRDVIDDILPEPAGGAHNDWDAAAGALHEGLTRHLADLRPLTADELRESRWEKFERMGAWIEA